MTCYKTLFQTPIDAPYIVTGYYSEGFLASYYGVSVVETERYTEVEDAEVDFCDLFSAFCDTCDRYNIGF